MDRRQFLMVLAAAACFPRRTLAGQGMGPGPGLGAPPITTQTFAYTGSVQTFTIPAGAYVDAAKTTPGAVFTCAGAGGAGGDSAGSAGDKTATSTLTDILGVSLDIYVGGAGSVGEGGGPGGWGYTNGVSGSGGEDGGGGGSSGVKLTAGSVPKMEAKGGNGGGPVGGSGGGSNSGAGITTTTGGGGAGGSSYTNGNNGWVTIQYYL